MNKFITLVLYTLIATVAVLASGAAHDKAALLKSEKENYDLLSQFNVKLADALGHQFNAVSFVGQKCDILIHLVESAEETASFTKQSKQDLLKELEDASAKLKLYQGKRETLVTEVGVLLQQLHASRLALAKFDVKEEAVDVDEYTVALAKEVAVQQSVTFHLYEIALNKLLLDYDNVAETVETASLRFNFMYQNLVKLLPDGESYEFNDALFKQVTLNGRYLFTMLKRLDLYSLITTFFRDNSVQLNKSIKRQDSHGNNVVDELKKTAAAAADYNEYVFNAVNPVLLSIHDLLLTAQNYNDNSLLTLAHPVVDHDDYFEVVKAYKVSTEKLLTALYELRTSKVERYFALAFDNFDKLHDVKNKLKEVEVARINQINLDQEQQRKDELIKEQELLRKQEQEREEKLEQGKKLYKTKGKKDKNSSYVWLYLGIVSGLAFSLALGVVVFKVLKDSRKNETVDETLLTSV